MTIRNFFICVFAVFMFVGCKKEGPAGKKSLINMVAEPSGANCTNGGTKITTGIDLNDNNILDENEIQNLNYVCNGSSGVNGITQINLNLFRNLGASGVSVNNVYYGNIIAFNKANYLTIDSVKLAISYVFTGDENTGAQAVKNISVELIDVTNNLAIENSKIITDDILLGQTKYSINLNNYLPNSTVNLGVFIRKEDPCYFTIGSVDLIIWRH